ncbi:MAG TPA: AAA family ATPase [Caulobacteraceae bacterium]|nr:AAA family ATPase [Caulobacteraceae bacterium]
MAITSFQGRRVLVIGQGLAETAREALSGALLEVGGPERIGRWTFGDMPDLLLIDADGAAPEVLVGAIDALARAGASPATVLAGERLPAGLVRALLRLPKSDVLEAPFAPIDLALAAAALMSPAESAAPAVAPSDSRCWTVTGAVGGAGATTIAIEIACNLAHRLRRDKRVALIDLNLADGAAAAYLGATSNMLLSRASAAPERIDAALLDVFSAAAPGDFDLLASARDPHAFEATSADAVLRLLEVACQVYDYVVVDMPRHRQSWSLDVLAGSDDIVIVSELTVPALLAARSLAAEIEEEVPGGARPRIVLNRLAKRVIGPAPSVAEAEKALQRKTDGAVTSDWEAAAASVNLGGPISQHRPKSRIVKDVDDIVTRLMSSPSRDAKSRAA